MLERKRTRLSPAEKNGIGGRWKPGPSTHEIGRAYSRPQKRMLHAKLPQMMIQMLIH